jgi:hypothetical protein
MHSTSADEIVCQPFKPIPFFSTPCTKPKWAQQGITIAGTTGKQGSSSIQLIGPSGIFIDHYDNLFIADEGNDRIQKFSPRSMDVGLTIAGGNGRGSALNQLKEPRDVYVDSAGTLFITDRGNLRVQKWFAGSAQGITIASGRGYSGHWFQGLSGNRKQINEIYSSESIMGRGRIMKYPLGGGNSPSYATLLGSVSRNPGGLVVDECNHVYVADPFDGNILKFSSGNSTDEQIASGLITPNDVALDTYGNLYIVERDTNRVQRLNVRDGTREVIVGNKEGAEGNDSEHLNKPWSIAFDSENNLYVSDKENHRVQKFSFHEGDLFC